MDEITAEYAAAAIATPTELRVRPRVTVAAKTDLGRVRENNEDKFEFFMPEDNASLATRGLIFLVCDGMGGHAAGQIASELTAKTFIDVYRTHTAEDPAEAAASAVKAANRYVLDVGRTVPGRRGMGTTLSGLILIQDRALIVQVGDSRIYRVRDGVGERLTVDHTFIEESIRLGTLTPEQAENHPHRHVLTRAVGAEDLLVPEVTWTDLLAGDRFLICSDGVTNHVSDDAIYDALRDKSPAEAAWHTVGQALLGGGSDNATVVVVRVDGLE